MHFNYGVLAAVSLVLVGIMLDSVLQVVFIPLNSSSVSELLAWIIAFLVASLIVGYMFGLKIQEEGETYEIRLIGGIIVLSALALMFFIMIWFANPLASPHIKDSLESIFNTNGWTNYDWSAYSSLWVTLHVLVASVFSFIGLYAGSMFKKPKKT